MGVTVWMVVRLQAVVVLMTVTGADVGVVLTWLVVAVSELMN